MSNDRKTDKAAAVRAGREHHRLIRTTTGRLLPLAEAADYAGLPYTTLRLAIAKGLIPVVRIPGSRAMYVDRRDLDRALDAWKERLT